MKEFLPDAKFAFRDRPVDLGWYNYQRYMQSGLGDMVSRPSKYSPHNLAEEITILQALFTGELLPRTEREQEIVDSIGGSIPEVEWPWEWCVCKRCRMEWRERGVPAGLTPLPAKRIDGRRWFFPAYCGTCIDYLTAKPNPKGQPPVAEETLNFDPSE